MQKDTTNEHAHTFENNARVLTKVHKDEFPLQTLLACWRLRIEFVSWRNAWRFTLRKLAEKLGNSTCFPVTNRCVCPCLSILSMYRTNRSDTDGLPVFLGGQIGCYFPWWTNWNSSFQLFFVAPRYQAPVIHMTKSSIGSKFRLTTLLSVRQEIDKCWPMVIKND